jgi:drug/metabolite transporter (DMT)-like permease
MDHQSEVKAGATPREGLGWLAHGPIMGMICILIATFFFSSTNAIIRALSSDLPPVEISFFRSLFGVLLQVPLVVWFGFGSITTKRPGLHLARGVLHAVSMILWFVALSLVPLAETAALEFAAPIMATIIAILFLGEVARMRRLVALAVGVLGVFIVVRPGFESVSWGQILVLVSVGLWAGCQLIIRELGRTDSAFVQGFYTAVIFVPITAAVAIPVWQWPTVTELGVCFVIALSSTIGIWFYGEAFRRAEMTAILPLEATKLLWAVLYGVVFFAEQPEVLTLLGGAIIFAAAAYITIREAQLARRAVMAPVTGE